MAASDDDWKAIRARKWQAEQQQRATAGTHTPNSTDSKGRQQQWPASISSKSAAARFFNKCRHTLQLGYGRSWQQAVAGGFLVLVLALMALSVSQQHRLNAGLNQSDTEPDAWQRPAHAHRAYILNKHDFVAIYSRKSSHVASERASRAIHGSDMWSADFDMDKGGITRCTTTQYAMTTYFCGKAIADTDMRLSRISSAADLREYVKAIDSVVQNPANDSCALWPELVLRFHVSEAADESLGHTFVMHFLPEGGVQVYQSFITHYTLQAYLKKHGPLDAAGLEQFISNLEVVTSATAGWGPREDAAYKSNFLVSLGNSAKVAVGVVGATTRQGPWARRGSQTSEPIVASIEPACLVNPWAGPGGESIAAITQPFLDQ